MRLLFLCLLLTTGANSAYTPCVLCIDEATPDQLAAIEIRLYTGSTVDDYTTVLAGDALELLEEIDNSKPTVLYTHGWGGSPEQNISQAVISAYVAQGGYNFMILDWGGIAKNEYTFAANSVEGVGYTLAMALNDLVAGGLDTSRMNVVGLSLGAHVSGFAGRYTNFTIPRITGLDPAGIGFYLLSAHLASGDAEFVNIIHTNFGELGIGFDTGDVDFHLNDGILQPSCPILNPFCSHERSTLYYADSVRYKNSFIGLACDSYDDFKAGECNSNATVIMGNETPTSTRGKFYLETNSESPYGRGKDGIVHEESSESLIEEILDLF